MWIKSMQNAIITLPLAFTILSSSVFTEKEVDTTKAKIELVNETWDKKKEILNFTKAECYLVYSDIKSKLDNSSKTVLTLDQQEFLVDKCNFTPNSDFKNYESIESDDKKST